MTDLINIGAAPNDRSGDDFRTVCTKINGFYASSQTNMSTVESNKLDATVAALLVLLDNLPQLPTDPTFYPAAGGLFQEGDSSGYRIVRLYPRV